MDSVKKFFCWIFGVFLAAGVLCSGILAYWYFGATNYHLTGVPVVNYHQVNTRFQTCLTMTPKNFEEQMKYLHDNGYHSITQAQFSDYLNGRGELPDRPVLITFDDGYIDNYEDAYPIMKKYGMTGTIFVIINLVNQPGYLTWQQIETMGKDGIEFGSHTISHKPLTSLDETAMNHELVDSKALLEQHLGQKVLLIAYPEGKYNTQVKQATEAAGYSAAFTVNTGRDFAWDDHYELDRVPFFEGPASFQHFRFRLIFSAFSALLWKTHAYFANTDQLKHMAHYIPQP